MATVTELRERYAHLLAEGAPLAEKSQAGELNGDEAARFDAIAREAKDLAGELSAAESRAREAEAMKAEAARMAQSAGRATAQAAVEGKREPRDIGSRFVQSDAFQRALAGRDGVTGREGALRIGSFDVRTLLNSGALATEQVQDQVLPGLIRPMDAPLTARTVLINATTTSDAVTFIQDDGMTNNAAKVDEASTTTDQTTKPESALAFNQETANVVTLAHWIPVTRQALADAGQLAAYINDRLIRGLREVEDDYILNDTTVGLTAVAGQVLDGTYFTANPVQNAGGDVEPLNRIHRGITEVRVTGMAMPGFVMMNPADVELINTLGDANDQYYAGGPFSAQPNRIWGLPVVESQNITAGSALIGDGSQACVFDRQQAAIYTSDSHDDFFIRNIITVLAEERIALAVFRPAAFALVELY